LHRELLQNRIAELKSHVTKGGPREGVIRGLLYVGMARGEVDERGLNALRRIRQSDQASRLTLSQFKDMAREQFFLLLLDPEAALAAIPKLLPPDIDERRKGLAAIRNVLSASGEITGEAAERMARITRLFEADIADSVPFSANSERAKAS
jgi:type II secretory pathway component HofQ